MRSLELLKDFSGEAIIVKTSQDCSDILEQNRIEQYEPEPDLGFGRKVASIPIDVLDAWIREGIDYRKISKDPAMKKKFFARLNDPEFRYFKTTTGHIGC